MRIEVSSMQSAVACDMAAIRAIVRLALDAEGRDGEVDVALVCDGEMVELNRRYLGREGATDVLAFPYDDAEGLVCGEVVANAERAAREAEGRSHAAEDELLLYVVHGVLHLLGYDDLQPSDAERMRSREQEVLRAAGRVVALCRELPVKIGYQALVLNRVRSEPPGEPIQRELAKIDAPRLEDVPQDDEVERAGAVGNNVFSLPHSNSALVAVGNLLETLHATMSAASEPRTSSQDQ